MNFNHDTGAIEGLLTIDATVASPINGATQSLVIVGNGALYLPVGTNGQRPANQAGMLRYNSDGSVLEFNNGSTWSTLSTSSGTVTSVAISGSTGLSVGGSPITGAGTITLTLDTGLQNLSAVATTGIVAATGTDTWATRTISGTSGRITLTNGDGISGNPTIDLATVTNPGNGGSLVKITTDSYGRVTNSTAVVASDITALVDTTYVNTAGDTMTSGANLTFVGGGEVLGLPATPSSATAAVSKAYVDSVIQGLDPKQTVRVATTTSGTLASSFQNGSTVDTVTLSTGDRILIKNQSTQSENGIYTVNATGAPTRAADMDSWLEVPGAFVFIEEGSQADTGWVCTSNAGGTLGSTAITWVQFSNVNGVTSLSGTANQISASASTGVVTLSIPSTFIAPGTIASTTTITAGSNFIASTGTSSYTSTTGTAIQVVPGAAATSTSAGGSLFLRGGPGGSTSGNAGGITIQGGTPVDGNGGAITVTGSNGVGVNQAGGDITITAGNPTGTGAAGSISITAGALQGAGTAGAVTITGGAGNGATTGGAVTLQAGSGGSSGTGAVATLRGGAGGSSTGAGGAVTVAGGIPTAGAGGTVNITAAAGVGTNQNGGNVVITAGARTGTGTAGVINLVIPTTGTLQLNGAAGTAGQVLMSNGSTTAPTWQNVQLGLALYSENPSAPTTPVASGTNSVALGTNSNATATDSFAVGDGSSAVLHGAKAFANGIFSTDGDAQKLLMVVRRITTDDTANVELFLDGSSTRMVLPNNSAWTFTITVVGRRTDATGGAAGYKFEGVARKDTTAGSMTFVGTPSKVILGETNAGLDASLAADTTNGSLNIRVTGLAAATYRWVATVDAVQVTN